MYHLGRVWRRKYEGRGEKRCRSVRTDEVRKWDERPRREVEGMDSLIAEALAKIKTTDPLRLTKHAARRNRN